MAWPGAEHAFVALILMLPGFVFVAMQERIVPSPRRDFSKSAVEFFGYGGMNFVLFSWAIVPRLGDWAALTMVPSDYVLVPVVTIAGPALAAVMWVRLGRSTVLDRLAGMGSNNRALEPAAWDYFFGRRKGACWVLVRLRNGTNLAGLYEKGSYASRYPEPRSLYLRRLYRTDEEGNIGEPVLGSAGAIINGDDIHLIEFWEMTDDQER